MTRFLVAVASWWCSRTTVYVCHVHVLCSVWSIECRRFESHPRQLIFSRKSDCLGCAVLLYLVCLTLLASFFHLSFKNLYIYTRFGVWCHWWFHYPGLLLHTELMVSLSIRCTMRCEIWAQPAELPR